MKRFLALLFSLSCLLMAFGCGGSEEPAAPVQEGTEDSAALTIGILPDTQSVPIVVAQHFGYFGEEGVDVDVTLFNSASERDSALQSGNLDIAISDLIAACLLREGGFDVAATSLTDGSQDLITSPNSGISDIQGLKGKTLALSENTIMEYAGDRILTNYGLDPETDVEKTYIPQMTVRMEMLANNKVDSVVMPEPQSGIALSQGATLIATGGDLNINGTCLIVVKESVQNRAADVTAFYKAYNRAVEYLTATDPSEYMDFLIEEGGLPETAKETMTLPEYRPATAPGEGDVEEVNTWLVGKGLLEEAIPYSELVDAGYLPQ